MQNSKEQLGFTITSVIFKSEHMDKLDTIFARYYRIELPTTLTITVSNASFEQINSGKTETKLIL